MSRYYFLVYFIFTSCPVAGQSPKYVLKGTGHLLRPDISGQPNSILWKHNGNKVVEFDGSEQHVYSPFEDRVTLGWVTAELEITGLRFEDSGVYEYELDINNNLHSSEFKLEVIDKVAMPTISCETNEGSSSDVSGIQATLLCSAEPRPPQSSLKFEWRSQGKLHSGQKLTISLGDKHDEEVYSCSVSNPLSSVTATFTAKQCYPDKSSSVALIVGLVITGLVICLLVLGIVCCKRKQKVSEVFSGAEEEVPP
uniref:lymphocyte function-associated antigen 3-like n=1 Tax=Semicossyphus pulcher TaxID=241346 RepID=UPI0037E7AC62